MESQGEWETSKLTSNKKLGGAFSKLGGHMSKDVCTVCAMF